MLNDKQLQQFLKIQADTAALAGKAGLTLEETDAFIDQEGKRLEKILPKEAFLDGWAENIEVFFVAIVIALGIRTYVLQPFSIPTDSMKPTLWGIYRESRSEPPPGLATRAFELLIHGKNYHYWVAEEPGRIKNVTEGPLLGFLPFFKSTVVTTDKGTHRLFTAAENIPQDQRARLMSGATFSKGDILANFSVEAGDHLFVNKMVYHFFKPKRGDVFVFTTHGIREIEMRSQFSQFYIKRCVGVSGDRLEIRPPHLLVNGDTLDSRDCFERIYSMKDGYHGYVFPGMSGQYLTGPGKTHQVPEDGYWAMGDNSANSFDSRGWGPVVRQNLVGTGLWVYWPFTKRWGLVD